MGVQGTSSTVEDTLSFKEPEHVHRVHRVHRTMKYVLFISFSFFSAHMNIQGLDLRFGLPSRDIPPGTAFQTGVFYRPNGRFHRQRTFLERKIRCIQSSTMYSGPLLVHSRPSGLLFEPQLGRYAGIPGAPTTSYLLWTFI